MTFEPVLCDLVDRTDAKGAILLDWEGESVAQCGTLDDYDLRVIGAYQVIILNHIRKARETERVEFFQMKFESMMAQFMPVTRDYYVLLLFNNREMAPRALHSLMQVVESFARDIA